VELLKIDLESLSFDGKELLREVHLTLKKGDKVLIKGATGSGKTSLMHTINLMNPNYIGTITFHGRDIRQYAPDELRSRIMEVMQEPWLDNTNCLEALQEPWTYAIHTKKHPASFGTETWKQKVNNYLEAFGLDETYLNKPVSQLSGGEKQRLALIRVLQFEPEVLLLDEISSALDQNTSSIISSCILNNFSGTVIAISHDPHWQNSWKKTWQIENKKVHLSEV